MKSALFAILLVVAHLVSKAATAAPSEVDLHALRKVVAAGTEVFEIVDGEANVDRPHL